MEQLNHQNQTVENPQQSLQEIVNTQNENVLQQKELLIEESNVQQQSQQQQNSNNNIEKEQIYINQSNVVKNQEPEQKQQMEESQQTLVVQKDAVKGLQQQKLPQQVEEQKDSDKMISEHQIQQECQQQDSSQPQTQTNQDYYIDQKSQQTQSTLNTEKTIIINNQVQNQESSLIQDKKQKANSLDNSQLIRFQNSLTLQQSGDNSDNLEIKRFSLNQPEKVSSANNDESRSSNISEQQQQQYQRHQQITINDNINCKQIISETLFEKKRQRYVYIKSWYEKRAGQASVLLKVIDNLSNNLIKISESSNENYNLIIQYFKDRVAQDIKFSTTQNCKISGAFGQQTSGNSIYYYEQFNDLFKQFEAMHLKIQKNISLFANYVDQYIIKDILQDDMQKYRTKAIHFRELTRSQRDRALLIEGELNQLFKEYVEQYGKMAKTVGSSSSGKGGQAHKPKKKDILYIELNLLYQVGQQMIVLRNYGQETMKLIEDLKNCEKNRMQLLKLAIQCYADQYREYFVNATYISTLQTNLQDISADSEVQQNFQIENLLLKEDYDYIKNSLGVEDLDFTLFQEFLDRFEIKNVQEQPFITNSITAMQGQFYVSIMLCLDQNIVVTELKKEHLFNKPLLHLYIDSCTFLASKDKLIIKEEHQNFFYSTYQDHIFYFETDARALEVAEQLNDAKTRYHQQKQQQQH